MNIKTILLQSPLMAVYGSLTRWRKPSAGYFLASRSTKPLSNKFGFDRGTPIDRYWITAAVAEWRGDIHGRVLEIGDNRYTTAYGSGLSRCDILDIVPNPKATVVGDLRNLSGVIADNSYDCIVLTHVLGMIDDYPAALRECYRILKPGGVIIATISCFSPTHDQTLNLWRFTPAGAKYAFSRVFPTVAVRGLGNVLSGQCFWVGMAQEELSADELSYNDPEYPCIVGIRAVKTEERQ